MARGTQYSVTTIFGWRGLTCDYTSISGVGVVRDNSLENEMPHCINTPPGEHQYILTVWFTQITRGWQNITFKNRGRYQTTSNNFSLKPESLILLQTWYYWKFSSTPRHLEAQHSAHTHSQPNGSWNKCLMRSLLEWTWTWKKKKKSISCGQKCAKTCIQCLILETQLS